MRKKVFCFMTNGFKFHNQWFQIPYGSHVYLLQSTCIITAIRGEPLTTDINWVDDKLHCGMPGGSMHYEDEKDQRDEHDAIPTASQR